MKENPPTVFFATILMLVFAASAHAVSDGVGTNDSIAPPKLVTVAVQDWYPQNTSASVSYVFVCNAIGFTPASYSYDFGDGQSWKDVTFADTYHTYTANGKYLVACSATDGNVTRGSNLSVVVSTLSEAVTPPIGNETNGTNNTNDANQTCAGSVASIPAACNGGTIIRDDFNRQGDNCRHIICSNQGIDTVNVKACDKPDGMPQQYFEMYRESFAGMPPKLCIGSTCVQDNGFARSGNFPICANATPPANQTNGTHQANDTNVTPPTNQTCFSSVERIPATCDGGSIISDTDLRTTDNCRHTVCQNGINRLEVKACDKPNEVAPQYFEIYKQGQNGTQQLRICIDGACIQDNGYAKSRGFPACIGNMTPPVNNTNATNVTPPANNTNQTNGTNMTPVCFNTIAHIPATCAGGTITEDTDLKTFDNCRHITCSDGLDNIRVKACEKPDETSPMYFEMYKLGQSGTRVSEICIGDTCIRDNGFARSGSMPICLDHVPPPLIANSTLDLSVAPHYPQGRTYVFVCTAHGFTPTSYSWFFDDGQKLLDVTNGNIMHTYAPGNYTPICVATNGIVTEAATMHAAAG